MANRSRTAAVLWLAIAAAVCAACGTTSPTAGPTSIAPTSPVPTLWTGPSPTSAATPAVEPTPTPTAQPSPQSIELALAVVSRFDDPRLGVSADELTTLAEQGKLLLPCDVSSLRLNGAALVLAATTACLPPEQITARLQPKPGEIALLPPGFVTPSVKVLPIDSADLFGSPSRRAQSYPLVGAVPASVASAPAWAPGDPSEVRTLISTGDTCPDRGVSHQTLVLKKGWDWAFDGGGAKYTGFARGRFGWSLPSAVRTGDGGAMDALLSDHDVAVNDFECPTVSNFRQHDQGLYFTIDPAFPAFLAKRGGVDAVTIGSNHMDDLGASGITQTVAALDAAGIAHTGAGLDLARALAPAIVDVRGVRFAFVGWDDGGDATPQSAGTAPLTRSTVCSSLSQARASADIVIAMPQWGFPEYHPDPTSRQRTQRAIMYECGADDILGSGTHVASWASIDSGPNGPRVALGSHGNFFFDQNWARWTMEGVVPELTFYGKKLVQFRLHPYTILDDGQPNLIDPLTDGAKVVAQVWNPKPFECCRP